MSGFDPETGIFELNGDKAIRYLSANSILAGKDWRDHCAQLFRDAGFEVLRKTPYGIEVVADDTDVFEVLSGKTATWGSSTPAARDIYTRWLAVREWLNATLDLLSPSRRLTTRETREDF